MAQCEVSTCNNAAAFVMTVPTPLPLGTAVVYDLVALDGRELAATYRQADCRLDDFTTFASDPTTLYLLATAPLGETTLLTSMNHPTGGRVICEIRSTTEL